MLNVALYFVAQLIWLELNLGIGVALYDSDVSSVQRASREEAFANNIDHIHVAFPN